MTTGTKATATTTVTATNTAKTVGSGNLEVFATPMMIALMEEAACNALANHLEPGQSSVGTEVAISHTAPSRLGATITATAIIEEIDKRRVVFSVSASDDAGEIGAGRHIRFIIDAEKFMDKVAER